MAITGALVADFSSFIGEAAKAETSLKGMERAAVTTEKALDKMVDGVDTAPAVAEVSKLDGALKGVSASAKGSVTPALDELGSVTVDTTGKTKGFKDSLSEVDKVLAAAGINLGPLPKALDQLSSAADGSSTALGMLGKAFLVVATAKAAWDTGRWIAELGGLDDKVADFAAGLMGTSSSAVEAAAAQETLAKASAIAGQDITNMTSAVRILTRAQQDQFAANVETNKELEKTAKEAEKAAQFSAKLFSQDDIERAWTYVTALNGVENVTKLTTDKKKELNRAVTDAIDAYHALGEHAPKALRDIASATTPLITVTASFASVSSGVWAQFKSQAEAGGDTIAKVTDKAKLDWTDLGRVTLAELVQTATEAQEKYDFVASASESATTKEIDDVRRLRDEAQAAVDAWGGATLDAYDDIKDASTATTNKQIADNKAVVDNVKTSWIDAMSAVSAGMGTMTGTVSGVVDTSNANRTAIQRAWDENRYFGPVTGGTPENPKGTGPNWSALGFRADGGPVRAGAPYLVGERGPELMVPSSSGRVAAAGTFGGGITVNISTVMGNPQEIARVVSAALVDTARAQGARLPVGG